MDTEDATNPAADEDVVASKVEEVAEDVELELEDEGPETEDEVQPEDDSEEIEFQGAKHRVPKALKGAFMLHADYTRKTQELADSRRAWETERTQEAEAFNAFRNDQLVVATHHQALESLRQQRDQYANVDWATLQAQDPDAYQTHRERQRALRDAILDTEDRLQSAQEALKSKVADYHRSEAERLQETEMSHIRATMAELSDPVKGIKGWGPDKFKDLAGFALDSGASIDEIKGATAAHWRLLNLAKIGAEALKAKTRTDTLKKVVETQPAATVAKGKPATVGLSDDLPMDEWMRRHEARERKKRQAA